MSVFDLFKPTKQVFSSTDKSCIERANRHLSNQGFFSKLYIEKGRYIQDGFTSDEDKMRAFIESFLKTNNDLTYILLRSPGWQHALGDTDPRFSESLKALSRIGVWINKVMGAGKIELRETKINGTTCLYPYIICEENDDKTREFYIEKLKPFVNLIKSDAF